MAENITWADREDATTPTGAATEADKTIYNTMKSHLNEPVQKLTAFTDTDIIIDGTKRYSTTKVITGSTHTITANATLSNHKENNYILSRYQFDVDCDLTLTNFDATGSTLGTINPIAAGTYNLWFYATSFGVALVIQNNTGTTLGTLATPTLVLSVGNGQLGYTISGIDSNATAGVLEYSTDNVNWTTWGSYSFGTETGNITGLNNGTLYYGRYRNSASGYNPSSYAEDSAVPNIAYNFENTYEMVANVLGDGVTVLNNDCYPSNGVGVDSPFSASFWIEFDNLSSNKAFLVARDNNDDSVLMTLQCTADNEITMTMLTDGSNTIQRKTNGANVVAGVRRHFVYTYDGSEAHTGIKIYLDGVEQSYQTLAGVGTYTGLPAIVGDFELDYGNSQGAASANCIMQIVRIFNIEILSTQVTYLYNSGAPIGIDSTSAPTLNSSCQQENLFNNTPNADNIGADGVNQGTVTYQSI